MKTFEIRIMKPMKEQKKAAELCEKGYIFGGNDKKSKELHKLPFSFYRFQLTLYRQLYDDYCK